MRPRIALDPTLIAICALAALIVGPNVVLGQPTARPRGKPNVLFIMFDQLNASVLSCYGGPVLTPHIDRLAREGVRFNQAVCPTPFCSPTRASIVTGMYPHAHGIVLNAKHKPGPSGQRGLTADDITTERILHGDGYATHFYGKWHLRGEQLPYYPDMYTPGFEYADQMAERFDRVRATDPAGWMKWYTWALPVEITPSFQRAVDGVGDRWKDVRFADFIAKMGRLELPLEEFWFIRLKRTSSRGWRGF